jgi:hypothetical protein
MACQEGHDDIVAFLLDKGADINKQENQHMSPLHYAIHEKRFETCKLILDYEQVSNQNIESGITMSRIRQVPQIQSLLEKALKKRRKVILVCHLRLINRALSILNSPKRYVTFASWFLKNVTDVPDARLQYTAARYFLLFHNLGIGLSDATLEESQNSLHRRVNARGRRIQDLS